MTDLSPKVTGWQCPLNLIYIRRRHAAGERPLIQHVSARTGALGIKCLVPGSGPGLGLPGRYLETCNTAPRVYSMHSLKPSVGKRQRAVSSRWHLPGVTREKDDISQLIPRTKADPGPSEQAVAHPDPSCCRCQGSDACVEWSG